jgi:hypothetical protein
MMRFQPPGAPPHGASLHIDRAWDMWVPASQFAACEGAPDLLGTRGSTGNGYEKMAAWALDGASSEGVVTTLSLPAHWVSGTVTGKVHWAPTTSSTAGVLLQIQAVELAAATQIDKVATMTPFGTFTPSGVAEDLNIASLSLGTPSARLMRLVVRRDGSDSNTVDVWFIGLLLEFTVDE